MQTLKNRADFVALNKRAAKWSASGVVIQALRTDTGAIRIGYTVTKKTEKSAVRRNRIKRRLRAAARAVVPAHAATGRDYVLIGKQATADRPFDLLCGDIKFCLQKLGCAQP